LGSTLKLPSGLLDGPVWSQTAWDKDVNERKSRNNKDKIRMGMDRKAGKATDSGDVV
jgi:hypothetical protein